MFLEALEEDMATWAVAFLRDEEIAKNLRSNFKLCVMLSDDMIDHVAGVNRIIGTGRVTVVGSGSTTGAGQTKT